MKISINLRKSISFVLLFVLIWSMGFSYALADMSDKERDTVSKTMTQKIENDTKSKIEDLRDERVRQIFRTLVEKTSRKNINYRVKVVKNKDVNAYAMPNGEVVFYTGLLDILPKDDPAPLAFVAAHELSHIEKKHADKKLRDMLLTGIGIALLVRKSKTTTKILGGVAFGILASGYSRKYETEADREALKLMRSAGYDPNGSLVVLNIFKSMSAKKGSGLRIFPSHPTPADRYKNVVEWMQEQGLTVKEPAPINN